MTVVPIEEAALSIRDSDADRHWSMFVTAPLPDGASWTIAFGGAPLNDALQPIDAPAFVIDKRIRINGEAGRIHRVPGARLAGRDARDGSAA